LVFSNQFSRPGLCLSRKPRGLTSTTQRRRTTVDADRSKSTRRQRTNDNQPQPTVFDRNCRRSSVMAQSCAPAARCRQYVVCVWTSKHRERVATDRLVASVSACWFHGSLDQVPRDVCFVPLMRDATTLSTGLSHRR